MIAIVFGGLAGYVWATIPVNFSGITVEPTIQVKDAAGNVETLTVGTLSTVTYPDSTHVKIGAQVKVDLVGFDSTSLQWQNDYRLSVTSDTGKSGTYDDFEGGWSTDASWAPYWSDWFAVSSGESFALEPEKKAWWYISSWNYRYGDGWMVLDPNRYDSIGDWIKWSGGLGENPKGHTYTVKLSMHLKVNYIDAYDDELCAIGPPGDIDVRQGTVQAHKSGELVDILTYSLVYGETTATVTVTPTLGAQSWIPLDMNAIGLSPMTIGVASVFTSLGLPVWAAHATFTGLAIVFAVATVYFHKKED